MIPVSLAVLFAAVCLIAQPSGLDGFLLGEDKSEVARLLGAPKLISPFGTEFEGWQFQIGETEEREFSHHLVFRKSDGKLISLARDYPEPIAVDSLFPPAESFTFSGPGNWNVRVHPLGPHRYLLATGVSRSGQTTQIVLLDDTALSAFYPWLFDKLAH